MTINVVVVVVPFLLVHVCLSAPITISVFPNTVFLSFDAHYELDNLSPIDSSNMCLCRCYNISICFTVTYIGANQTCILYFAQLSQGQLQSFSISMDSRVYSFGNRNLSGKLDRHVHLLLSYHPSISTPSYTKIHLDIRNALLRMENQGGW